MKRYLFTEQQKIKIQFRYESKSYVQATSKSHRKTVKAYKMTIFVDFIAMHGLLQTWIFIF